MKYAESVVDLIGNTPLVKLSSVTAHLGPDAPLVLAKVEYVNPGGSVKDRIASRMIDAAEASGELKPGGTIVEPVYIEDGVTIEDSIVGPNVSVGAGSVIRGSHVTHAVIGQKSALVDSTLTQSMLGDHAVVEGVRGSASIGDHGEVRSA